MTSDWINKTSVTALEGDSLSNLVSARLDLELMMRQVLGLEQDELPDALGAQKSKEAEDVLKQETNNSKFL